MSGGGAAPLPFNRPFRTGEEGTRVTQAIENGWTGGNGPMTALCQHLLGELTGAARVLLTPSCTAALEMAALLVGVGPGDEVVLPSFTFSSTANAFVLRGATPVFVDVDERTLCLDPELVADAVGPRTRVVVPVHYGGVGCDMGALDAALAGRDALVVEDAAQGIGAAWDGTPLGVVGDLGTLSFHETKNVSCGEGGALLLRDSRWVEAAEVLQEKGTNRARFSRGEIARYTWVDRGSSFLMADATAAILLSQLEHVEEITRARLRIWEAYHAALEPLEARGLLRRPHVPEPATPNGHLYFVRLAPGGVTRAALAEALARRGIAAYSHYVPLHSSPAGRRFGRVHGPMTVTEAAAEDLLRLPVWPGLTDSDVERVVEAVGDVLA